MEAIEIVLVPKGAEAPGATGNASIEKEKIDKGITGLDDTTGIEYSSKVLSMDKQKTVMNGAVSGIETGSKGLEMFSADVKNLDGRAIYNTYLINKGWQTRSKGDNNSGIENEQIEALWIKLTGEAEFQFDIYYQTKTANSEWLDWAKNGEIAGNIGTGNPVQAIRIVLVPKGMAAPGKTEKPFGEHKVVATPGVRTVENFLATALLPVGQTNYVWGGGWNVADNAAGEGSVHIGVMPEWKAYFDKQDANYDYKANKFLINNGLDCSGFVGWTVYNTLNTVSNNSGELTWANDMAEWYANKGYGTVENDGHLSEYKPGDIISMYEGHVYICLGTCDDGSILLVHSSPPGVMISGTTPQLGQSTQATQLAHEYMQKYYPEYYNRYKDKMDRKSTDYQVEVDKFTWGNNFVKDPEGIREMKPEQVLKVIFNEQ